MAARGKSPVNSFFSQPSALEGYFFPSFFMDRFLFFLLSEASAAPELHFCRPSIHSPPGTDREARRQNLTLSDLRLLSLPSCSADSDWFGSDRSLCVFNTVLGGEGGVGGLSRNGAGIGSPSELQQNLEPLLHRQLFTATKRDEKSFSN